jgi:hypothetical protein
MPHLSQTAVFGNHAGSGGIGVRPSWPITRCWHSGERISAAFVESTVNLVVSRRFAKKQPMPWSKIGAHLPLQTRTKTLAGPLRDLFTGWCPAMAVNDNQAPALAAAA